MAQVTCKDCLEEGVTTPRATPHGGPKSPLCVTHYRARRHRRRNRAHELRTHATYGITADQYWALYAYQGGRCYICRRATGRTRRLAVDHEHYREGCSHAPDIGCQECVRGLLCSTCNRVVVGRYSREALQRAADYLGDPPARRALCE